MTIQARLADAALEATIIGGHTSIGYDVRRRLDHWDDVGRRDLSGLTYLVTGATNGIGQEAAAVLLAAGATVRSVTRSQRHAEEAMEHLRARTGGRGEIQIDLADMTRPADVDDYAARLHDQLPRLDGIAHCAGAFFGELTHTPEGLESNAAVYVVGPHRLTRQVLDLLQASRDPRVVFVSSSGAYARSLDLDAFDPDPADYRPLAAYAHAKRAQIVLTHAWAHHYPSVAFDAMTPGWCDTDLVKQGLPRFRATFRPILRTPAQGGDTLAWLMARPRARRQTDRLWRDRRPRLEHRLPWTIKGDSPDQLWDWVEAQSRKGQPAQPRS